MQFWIDRVLEKLYLSKENNLALYDRLTGCKNRNWLEYNRESMQNKDMYLIVCDMNGLKQTNDTFGHFAGDQLLLNYSKLFKDLFCGKNEHVIRLGGDEFLILTPHRRLDESFLTHSKHYSYGIAHKTADMDFSEAFKAADKNMYDMKKEKSLREA